MATNRKVIAVPKENFEPLRLEAGVSRATVYNALNGNSNSASAQKIRHLAATKYNGKARTKVVW